MSTGLRGSSSLREPVADRDTDVWFIGSRKVSSSMKMSSASPRRLSDIARRSGKHQTSTNANSTAPVSARASPSARLSLQHSTPVNIGARGSSAAWAMQIAEQEDSDGPEFELVRTSASAPRHATSPPLSGATPESDEDIRPDLPVSDIVRNASSPSLRIMSPLAQWRELPEEPERQSDVQTEKRVEQRSEPVMFGDDTYPEVVRAGPRIVGDEIGTETDPAAISAEHDPHRSPSATMTSLDPGSSTRKIDQTTSSAAPNFPSPTSLWFHDASGWFGWFEPRSERKGPPIPRSSPLDIPSNQAQWLERYVCANEIDDFVEHVDAWLCIIDSYLEGMNIPSRVPTRLLWSRYASSEIIPRLGVVLERKLAAAAKRSQSWSAVPFDAPAPFLAVEELLSLPAVIAPESRATIVDERIYSPHTSLDTASRCAAHHSPSAPKISLDQTRSARKVDQSTSSGIRRSPSPTSCWLRDADGLPGRMDTPRREYKGTVPRHLPLDMPYNHRQTLARYLVQCELAERIISPFDLWVGMDPFATRKTPCSTSLRSHDASICFDAPRNICNGAVPRRLPLDMPSDHRRTLAWFLVACETQNWLSPFDWWHSNVDFRLAGMDLPNPVPSRLLWSLYASSEIIPRLSVVLERRLAATAGQSQLPERNIAPYFAVEDLLSRPTMKVPISGATTEDNDSDNDNSVMLKAAGPPSAGLTPLVIKKGSTRDDPVDVSMSSPDSTESSPNELSGQSPHPETQDCLPDAASSDHLEEPVTDERLIVRSILTAEPKALVDRLESSQAIDACQTEFIQSPRAPLDAAFQSSERSPSGDVDRVDASLALPSTPTSRTSSTPPPIIEQSRRTSETLQGSGQNRSAVTHATRASPETNSHGLGLIALGSTTHLLRTASSAASDTSDLTSIGDLSDSPMGDTRNVMSTMASNVATSPARRAAQPRIPSPLKAPSLLASLFDSELTSDSESDRAETERPQLEHGGARSKPALRSVRQTQINQIDAVIQSVECVRINESSVDQNAPKEQPPLNSISWTHLQEHAPLNAYSTSSGMTWPRMATRANKWTPWSSRLYPGSRADLIPALDRLYDGGKYRHVMRAVEEENLWTRHDMTDKQRLVMCIWNRWKQEAGPMPAKLRQAGWVVGLMDKYGPILCFAEVQEEFNSQLYLLFEYEHIDDTLFWNLNRYWVNIWDREKKRWEAVKGDARGQGALRREILRLGKDE